jgi:peptidyl-prolyl cis-trans isomerase B (cyclophilin B)
MKRISALCALAIAVASLTPVTVSAAERPTSVKGCAKPTAKAHAPATLKQPTSVDRS